MHFKTILPDPSISFIVKDILVFEEHNNTKETILPFFADGFPGLTFHNTPNGKWVQPQNKKMPVIYLYGQTIHPIQLHIQGSSTIVVFQLYPFVINSLFHVDAKELNNGCYDLNQIPEWCAIEQTLLESPNLNEQIAVISDLLWRTFTERKQDFDLSVKEAIHLILSHKALITVSDLSEKLHMTIRTLERRFTQQVGISVKHFIQITKFQQSFEQLSLKDYKKLTDIVYSNGFADQSHFIRVFKAFTGETPAKFKKKTPNLS
ncbi:MAG: helix-turn-helix domain-containing protein [Bacteroidota bacterium]